ncbi:DUF4167 domain-containing protein [Bartonella sp. CB175]|uniref:DUF4167 domain-containing protein n=1 Tax=Bartonella sp. CB175 TaxID=3112256 RepID=UPI00300DC165
MRPQQNRRVRGRNNNNNGNNNNNRRGPNPLSRNYESSGPDVKIRGNAQQIADKYISLARDAQGSGDRIMSENYLQHAEHYLRIILAAVAQMSQPARRDENSEQECDEVNIECEKRDDVSSDKSASKKKNNNGQQTKAPNGHAGDELDAGALQNEKNGQEHIAVQENVEIVKKPRRAPRRRVVRDKEDPSVELAQEIKEIAKNRDMSTEEASSLALLSEELSEEVQRKPRRRRVVTSSAEGNV